MRNNEQFQREVKHLRERELQLQADLSTASREITKLRAGLKQKLVRELPWPGPGDKEVAARGATVDPAETYRQLPVSPVSVPVKSPSVVTITDTEDKTWHI